MAKKYGNTWWGMQWLNSLSNIDYSNRLPRGRSYANRGFVSKMSFRDNVIKSKVRGSRSTPYSIDVIIPKFSNREKKVLTDAIVENPIILSRLLNRELPRELAKVAQREGIQIFPNSWEDLDMKCSCPDWAVPCKHIASVIYVIAENIDQNPFLIFELHGYDVLSELKNRGLKIGKGRGSIDRFSELLTDSKSLDSFDASVVKELDFSLIENLSEPIMSMLKPKPLFYDKDFKATIQKEYRQAARRLKSFLYELEYQKTSDDNTFEIPKFELYSNLQITTDEFGRFKSATVDSSEHDSLFLEFETLLKWIDAIDERHISVLDQSIQALYYTYRYCTVLVQQFAYIPKFYTDGDSSYFVNWAPALFDEQVRIHYKLIEKIVPSSIIICSKDDGGVNETGYFVKDEILNVLSSLFIDHFVSAPSYKDNDVDELFFEKSVKSFSGLKNKEIPYSIENWLSNFSVTHKNFVPVLKIEEQGEVFEVSLMVDDRTKKMQEPFAFKLLFENSEYELPLLDVLRDLCLLADVFPDLNRVIESRGNNILNYTSETFLDILLKILPVIKMYGIQVVLPLSLKSLIQPKPSLSLTATSDKTTGVSYLNLNEMVDFTWQVAIGDELITQAEFEKLVDGASGLIKFKNQFILITDKELEKLYKTLQKDPSVGRDTIFRSAISEEFEGAKIEISDEVKLMFQELLKAECIQLPESLNATLRPYQLRGYEWMYKNATVGFGSIMAYDMGLGKTIQVITLLLKYKQEGLLNKKKSLVVVPTSLVSNWRKEIEKFAPELKSFIYHGPKRELALKDEHIVITTYGVLRSDAAIINKQKWHVLVIDEAQNIKNANTIQTKAVKKVKAPIKIALSGTPVENRLSEYWSIFDFVNKGFLGNLKRFKADFATPIETKRDKKQLELFKTITSPFIMRRLKTDKSIISDLPDKIENNSYANLSKEQLSIYQNVVDEVMAMIKKEPEENSILRRGLVLKLMVALKQICNHPSNYLKKREHNVELSGKSQLLMNILDNVYERNEKVLIFTQYKEMGDLLQRMIKERFGFDTPFFHGGLSTKKRDALVDDFQNRAQSRFLILSIKAAGTGLNLTAANHVVHYDLWWNPAVEAQATDRAFRIGQKKNVLVHRLISKGTFEEKINQISPFDL